MEVRFLPLAWIPGLFLLHNLEEALAMQGFLDTGRFILPEALTRILSTPTYEQFLLALIPVTALPWAFLLLLHSERTAKLGRILLLLTQTVLFLNVFSHLLGALIVGAYTPGLATALLINLPFSLYLVHLARSQGWIHARSLAALFAGAVLLHGPGLLGLLWLSTRLLPK